MCVVYILPFSVVDERKRLMKMEAKTDEKKEFVNKMGHGKYYDAPPARRVTISKEIADQLGFAHKENVDVEVLGPKRLLVTGKRSGVQE